MIVFETKKGTGSLSLCGSNCSRCVRVADWRALPLPLQKQKVAGNAQGWCRKVDGKHRVQAPGSRSTEKAGGGEQGEEASATPISLAWRSLSAMAVFVQGNTHTHTRHCGRSNVRDWDKDRSRRMTAEAAGEKKSLKPEQQ